MHYLTLIPISCVRRGHSNRDERSWRRDRSGLRSKETPRSWKSAGNPDLHAVVLTWSGRPGDSLPHLKQASQLEETVNPGLQREAPIWSADQRLLREIESPSRVRRLTERQASLEEIQLRIERA